MGIGLPRLPVGLIQQNDLQAVASLFANGAPGVWFDRQDLGSMYQDAAGTVPAAVNSPVGKCLDKSGRGNHATQGTSASRPILRQDASGRYYLEYDGFDDGMATAAMNFTTTDKLTVLAGVYKASDAATGVVCEHGIGGTDARAWTLNAPRGAAALDYGLDMRGVAGSETVRTTSFAAPHLAVLTGQMDYAGAALADEVKLRVNGGGVQTVSGVQNAEVGFGSYPLYIGNRGGASLPFNGRDYGLIVVGRALSATEISRAERFLASRMGVAL